MDTQGLTLIAPARSSAKPVRDPGLTGIARKSPRAKALAGFVGSQKRQPAFADGARWRSSRACG
ncbi:MAG: hypothetical protein M3546_11160 [Actinomycetota bacterium]|nr:hypothetical protein [Actinomycetota bacterium]